MVGATFLGNMEYVPCVVLRAHLAGPLLQDKPPMDLILCKPLLHTPYSRLQAYPS